ncbi:hypothetical protein KUTeg_015963 [Tegillarca granosa]|uniref:DUF7045 domain-containing protein n=1 Tax=Tegillarca granosa TaxID=220873 RepID=A0ABQ9EJG9_TEGGR|nr:hypothetical protein KUTeg_015963 [Tegillarca granosa]
MPQPWFDKEPFGRPTNDLHINCNDSQFNGAEKHILIPYNNKTTDCPAEGSFTYMDKSSDCRGRFNIGCRNKNEMEIESSCRANELTGTAKVDIYQCLVQWKEDDTHYVIAQKSGDVRKEAKCLAFRHTQSGLDVQEDSYCGKNREVRRNGVIYYVLFKPADKCVEKPKVPSPPTDTLPPKGITSDRSSIIDADSSSNRLRSDLSICVLVLLTFLHHQLGER